MDSSPTDCSRLALHRRGQPRAGDRLRQVADDEAGGRRRPLHLARHDGLADQARHPRLHRRARGRRSPIRSCRGRSARAARTKSANASAATSASRAGTTACRCAARRTRPSARNGGAAGIRSASTGKRRTERVLIVGGGPAGLECALTLGRRGHEVTLAEAGRALRRAADLRDDAAGPCRLEPRASTIASAGCSELTNVALYLESALGVDEIIDLGADRVVLATGARWTNDALFADGDPGRPARRTASVFTPDDIAAGAAATGPALVFDFDNYYMGGVLAEHLAAQGIAVTYVTPAGQASAWTHHDQRAAAGASRAVEAPRPGHDARTCSSRSTARRRRWRISSPARKAACRAARC